MKTISVKSEVIKEKGGSYGLLVTLTSGDTRKYESLFFSKSDAEELCELINRLGVSECHIDYVIEDRMP